MPPDGSKEGWEESEDGNRLRREIIDILRTLCVSWVEVQYGDDDHDNRVVSASGSPPGTGSGG